MKNNKDQDEWIPAMEAAKLLGVHYNSIRFWIKRKRVVAKICKYNLHGQNVKMALVLKSSLKTACETKCLWCGIVIKAEKPERKKFCCNSHRAMWSKRQAMSKKLSIPPGSG